MIGFELHNFLYLTRTILKSTWVVKFFVAKQIRDVIKGTRVEILHSKIYLPPDKSKPGRMQSRRHEKNFNSITHRWCAPRDSTNVTPCSAVYCHVVNRGHILKFFGIVRLKHENLLLALPRYILCTKINRKKVSSFQH